MILLTWFSKKLTSAQYFSCIYLSIFSIFSTCARNVVNEDNEDSRILWIYILTSHIEPKSGLENLRIKTCTK